MMRIGTWLLMLQNFVPISLLVSLEMIKYIQAMFIEWDTNMIDQKGTSALVQQSGLNEELG